MVSALRARLALGAPRRGRASLVRRFTVRRWLGRPVGGRRRVRARRGGRAGVGAVPGTPRGATVRVGAGTASLRQAERPPSGPRSVVAPALGCDRGPRRERPWEPDQICFRPVLERSTLEGRTARRCRWAEAAERGAAPWREHREGSSARLWESESPRFGQESEIRNPVPDAQKCATFGLALGVSGVLRHERPRGVRGLAGCAGARGLLRGTTRLHLRRPRRVHSPTSWGSSWTIARRSWGGGPPLLIGGSK